jgi:hypothetical protein
MYKRETKDNIRYPKTTKYQICYSVSNYKIKRIAKDHFSKRPPIIGKVHLIEKQMSIKIKRVFNFLNKTSESNLLVDWPLLHQF